MEIILATQNPGKILEIKGLTESSLILKNSTLEILETGFSLKENSELKSLETSKVFPNSLVLAEDSGLVIPVLGGLPGTFSGRFCNLQFDNNFKVKEIPPEVPCKKTATALNNQKVLHLMKDETNRVAYLATVFTIALNNQIIWEYNTFDRGFIAHDEIGNNGFGYDSIFIPDHSTNPTLLTYGQLSNDYKLTYGHRKPALEEIIKFILSRSN